MGLGKHWGAERIGQQGLKQRRAGSLGAADKDYMHGVGRTVALTAGGHFRTLHALG
jgi:hypothetical protein